MEGETEGRVSSLLVASRSTRVSVRASGGDEGAGASETVIVDEAVDARELAELVAVVFFLLAVAAATAR